MKRSRLRKWAKWACTLAAVLALCVAGLSAFYRLMAVAFSNGADTMSGVSVDRGLFAAASVRHRGHGDEGEPRYCVIHRVVGWQWGLAGDSPAAVQVGTWHAGALYYHEGNVLAVGLSLVYPVLLTVIPAALLWYADRRRSGPHTCKKCGYDRRGLATDIKCPECGSVPAPLTK